MLSIPSRTAVPGATISRALTNRGSCRASSSVSSSPDRGGITPILAGSSDRFWPRLPALRSGFRRPAEAVAASRSRAAPARLPQSGDAAPSVARHRLRPNLRASATRRSACADVRAARRSARARRSTRCGFSPPPSATPLAALATASATARSAPGSSTRTPPATLTKTSAAADRDARVASRARRARARAGCGRSRWPPAAAAPARLGATSAWTSTSSGREPSIAPSTTLAGRLRGLARRSAPTRPPPRPARRSRISNTPTSLVDPKRFLSARSVR